MSERPGLTRREALRITAVTGLSMALGGGVAAGLLRRAGLRRVTETRARLGTLVTLTSVHPDAGAARAVVDTGFTEIERLEAILSRHAPDTPMARLNREGRLPDPPDELLTVLRRAAWYHHRSEGAFDPTVAPLLELWARRRARDARPPGDGEIRRALERVGFEQVATDDDGVSFARPGVSLTLDGLAKGFVVDRAVAVLVAAGAERVVVDAGGDMASGGPGVGAEPWTVGVQDPHHADGSLGRVRLGGDAVATSGDYMRSFTPDRQHHHILDPRTGRSPDHTSSVTVVAGTAMDADALSTALLVMGPEAGLPFLERLPGAEGLMVDKEGTRTASAGLRRLAESREEA